MSGTVRQSNCRRCKRKVIQAYARYPHEIKSTGELIHWTICKSCHSKGYTFDKYGTVINRNKMA